MSRPDNNGLEQTGSAANGLNGPCSSIQCCAGWNGLAWLSYLQGPVQVAVNECHRTTDASPTPSMAGIRRLRPQISRGAGTKASKAPIQQKLLPRCGTFQPDSQ